MIERLLIDVELRDRLVMEASEHVLRFDWDDIAQRTRGIYRRLGKLAPRVQGARRG
jgi:glycogen(starch) synthase